MLVFTFFFKIFKQTSHYLKGNIGISLNLQAVYLKNVFSNFEIIRSRRKIICTFCIFGGKTKRNEVTKRKHWKFNIAIQGIYFFFCIYDNRPWHVFRCRSFVLFGWIFSGPRSQDFLAFSLSLAKEVFYPSPRICSSFQNREEPQAYFEKRFCLFLALQKVKWFCRKLCDNLTIVVMVT